MIETRADFEQGSSSGSLIARNLSWLHRHVTRVLGSELRRRTQPSDIVQSGLVQFWKKRRQFEVRNDSQFRALMVKLIQFVCCRRRRFHREQCRDARREQTASPEEIEPREVAPTVQNVLERERRAQMRRALARLDTVDQCIILLRWRGEGSFVEIGRQLSMSPDCARKRFCRARARLARLLCSEHALAS